MQHQPIGLRGLLVHCPGLIQLSKRDEDRIIPGGGRPASLEHVKRFREAAFLTQSVGLLGNEKTFHPAHGGDIGG